MKNYSIQSVLDGRKNNFDFIRFIASSIVIYAHSYNLSWATSQKDVLYIFSDGQFTLNKMAVAIFFFISGFLITQSMERSGNLFTYLRNRILRIIPGLAVVLLITTFIVGPLVTTLTLHDYFYNEQTFTYLKSIFLHPTYFFLPGVFESNPAKGEVNGALWTLEFEFFCYIIVALLWLFKLLNRYTFPILLAGYFIASHIPSVVNSSYFMSESAFELVKYFAVGMLFYLFRKHIILNRYVAIGCATVLIIAAGVGYYQFAFTFLGCYLVMYFAFLPTQKVYKFASKGDFSYGMYIYGFLIEQMVVKALGSHVNPPLVFVISYPLAIMVAALSWHLIEKRALTLKNIKLFKQFKTKSEETAF